MAVKIRLRRMGAKKAPFYRVVVADSRYPRDGRFIEEVGYYNPLTDPAEVKLDAEKITKWLENGAQPTDTVRALLKKQGAVVLEDTFGMHGSIRYLVYGPYWDMWDKEAAEICPYQNEELTCNPGNLPEYACDAVNTHIRPDHPYLDETALLEGDLPGDPAVPDAALPGRSGGRPLHPGAARHRPPLPRKSQPAYHLFAWSPAPGRHSRNGGVGASALRP